MTVRVWLRLTLNRHHQVTFYMSDVTHTLYFYMISLHHRINSTNQVLFIVLKIRDFKSESLSHLPKVTELPSSSRVKIQTQDSKTDAIPLLCLLLKTHNILTPAMHTLNVQ